MAFIASKVTYIITTILITLSSSSLKLVFSDESTLTCEYPCQPPPIAVTNCPPPPAPVSDVPVYSSPPPPSGVSGYWTPPPPPSPGNYPYYSPPSNYNNYNSPPPPNPILPWFPWYYYYNKAPVSGGISVFSKGSSGAKVVFVVVFAGLIIF